jgi:hypothetical protein
MPVQHPPSAPRKASGHCKKLLLLDQRVPPKKVKKSETDKGNALNFGAKKKQKEKGNGML